MKRTSIILCNYNENILNGPPKLRHFRHRETGLNPRTRLFEGLMSHSSALKQIKSTQNRALDHLTKSPIVIDFIVKR